MKWHKVLINLFAVICLISSPATQAKITVFAAASMSNVLEEIKSEYIKVNPQQEMDFSFASSSVLARQISQGAPAQLFISADQKWMDFLAEKGAIVTESRRDLLGNRLVMIAPQTSQIDHIDLQNSQWHSYLDNTYLAVGDPDHVPAGKYAKAAFLFLQQWNDLETKLARANNVRAALALVERGESPLGVVYATDAVASKKVKTVAIFPENTHPAIEYPVAIVKGQDNEESRKFLDYLRSESAVKIFQQFGFSAK
ncbi:molybdate ABC transporter substrate-binding protein [Histophilus somni]|uniref:molybdate ABC transporter substrate-binding protein n=1 Tax=Histophilus somni TaxID=731 RepID=UPI00201ED2EC|nr:molybdate ABC transporter substrate-binding protein [Histophilus somni]